MLPTIPAKRYFTIGEVAELCEVKPHVLRYWEQEFTQLRPIKRRGNRRYYQHHEVLMIRRIRDLLYGQGFTINGARNRLQEAAEEQRGRMQKPATAIEVESLEPTVTSLTDPASSMSAPLLDAPIAEPTHAIFTHVILPAAPPSSDAGAFAVPFGNQAFDYSALRNELLQLRELLCATPATEKQVAASEQAPPR